MYILDILLLIVLVLFVPPIILIIGGFMLLFVPGFEVVEIGAVMVGIIKLIALLRNR